MVQMTKGGRPSIKLDGSRLKMDDVPKWVVLESKIELPKELKTNSYLGRKWIISESISVRSFLMQVNGPFLVF